MNTQTVEITRSAPSTPDLGFVPKEVAGHFAALGQRCTFMSANLQVRALYMSRGWRVVTFDELPKEAQRAIRGRCDNPDRHFGECRLADCVLMVRSDSEREFWDEQDSLRNQVLEGTRTHALEGVAEEISRLARDAGVSGRVRLDVSELPTVADHVYGGSRDDKLKGAVNEKLNELASAGR